MSLNIITIKAIESVNKVFKDDFKLEMKESLVDFKGYLAGTNLSQEDKLTQYAQFSSNLFTQMISQSGQFVKCLEDIVLT